MNNTTENTLFETAMVSYKERLLHDFTLLKNEKKNGLFYKDNFSSVMSILSFVNNFAEKDLIEKTKMTPNGVTINMFNTILASKYNIFYDLLKIMKSLKEYTFNSDIEKNKYALVMLAKEYSK